MLSVALRSLRPSLSALFISGSFALAALAATSAAPLQAQSSASRPTAPDRLTQPILESNRVALPGTLHPLANAANDRGAVSDGMKLNRMQIVLRRSDAQEAALKQLIGEMHAPGATNYHKWLTPDDFGKRFGPSEADVAKLESWLGSHGFSVTKLNPGRQTLEFTGTAGQFRDTFHAQIHGYQVKGVAGNLETRYANASAPEIPAALAPVFGGFASLNNFRLKSQAKVLGKAQYNPATHETKPEWNYGTANGYNLVLAPADFAVQYDLNPLYNAATPVKGTGQSIAIVNESNINIALVNNYRTLFGLPANPPQVIIDGNDPGIDGINSPYGPNGASSEAYLDVEVSGAVAPNAQINLVIADDTELSSGLTLAMERAVYSNVSPILSLSFLGCELRQGSFNAFVNGLWEQAAAQGITVVVASGDNGSAGCDDFNSQEFAVQGQAVNGLASTPWDVAVGGTDFYYAGGQGDLGTYWTLGNANTSAPTGATLTKKVPEQPFNSSQFGLNLFPSSNSNATSIFAASGGASTCGLPTIDSSGNVTACAPYPKPSWQSGAGVPNDHARDLPDVSLFGSLAYNASVTPICASDGDCQPGSSNVQIYEVGGTSVSAPEFAGMMALVDQVYGRQGQANYVLYPLAAQFPTAFNDIQSGTVTVPCATTSVTDSNTGVTYPVKNCQTVTTGNYSITDQVFGTTTEGEIGLTAGTPAYNAGPNYDLASGLGSVDAYNMVTNWGSVKLGTTTTTLNPSSTTFAHGTAVTLSGTVTGASPTGNVGLITTSPVPLNGVGVAATEFPLSAGAFSQSVNYLPGGVYDISGYYPGDGANAASSSTPVQITVAAEPSTTALTVFSSLSTNTGNPLPASGASLSYGQPETFSAQEKGVNSSGNSTVPTGSVNFLNGSTILNTAVINSDGDAEFNAALAPGSYSVTANYSGDGSYNASKSATTSFMVVKNTPIVSFYVPYQFTNGDGLNGQTNYLAVSVENSVSQNALPVAPTGTVTVTGAPAGTATSATLVPAIDPTTGAPDGVAYFAVPANATGPYNLTFQYGGDTNYAVGTVSSPLTFENASGNGFLSSTVSATATGTQTSPTAQILLTATVTGQTGHAAPTGTLVLFTTAATYNTQGQISVLAQSALPTASGDSVTVSYRINSSDIPQGTNQIVLQYFPDNASLYNPSATEVTIANPLSDFSLVPLSTVVSVPNTGATPGVQTDTINLTSYNGFAGAVGLTCTSPTGVTCSLSSASATLASDGSASTVVTVNTTAVTKAGTYNVVITGKDSTGAYIHTVGLQVVTPLITSTGTPSFTLAGGAVTISAPGGTGTSTISATPTNSFTGSVALSCAVTASPAGATGTPTCSLNPASVSIAGAAVSSTLTVDTTSATTAGTYTVTVTGVSGAITQTAGIQVTVTGAVTSAGTFALSSSPASVTIATQGGTGSSTITVTPNATTPYAGVVALSCAVTASPSGATLIPTCSLAPASVTLAGAALTSTLTINTTAQTGKLDFPLKGIFKAGGGVALATLLFFGIPFGRRGRRARRAVKALRILSVALFFAIIAGAAIGCGSGSSNGGGGTGPTGGTTTGTYTVTVTGTPTSGTAPTTTVSVTVN